MIFLLKKLYKKEKISCKRRKYNLLWVYASSHKLVEPTSMGKHEILPSGTFVEPLSFKLLYHQSLHLYKTFSSLMCQ